MIGEGRKTTINRTAVSIMQRSMSTIVTAKQIRKIMDALDLDIVKRHFAVSEISVNDDNVKENFIIEIEPFVVCDGVSVDAYNKFVDVDQRSYRIPFRLLQLDNNGRLLILEYPYVSRDITVERFKVYFIVPSEILIN